MHIDKWSPRDGGVLFSDIDVISISNGAALVSVCAFFHFVHFYAPGTIGNDSWCNYLLFLVRFEAKTSVHGFSAPSCV